MLGRMCEEGLLRKLSYGLYGPGPKATAYMAKIESTENELLSTAA